MESMERSTQNIIKMTQKKMGCEFTLFSYPQVKISSEDVLKHFHFAFEEVQRIEDLFTDFRPGPLQSINDNAGIKPIEVCQEVIDLIKKSFEFSYETKGLFDISFASIGHLWREAKKNKTFPDPLEVQRAKEWVDYQKIQMKGNQVYLPSPFMKISMGGIGKGYAVDKAFEYLLSQGIENFYVNGSGDIRAHSRADAPRPWRFGIKNPFAPNKVIGLMSLSSGAMATSGDYYNKIEIDGKKWHHILNPFLGQSCNEIVSVTLLTPTAIEADVYGTYCLCLGADDVIKFMDSKMITGSLVDSNGRLYLSKMAITKMKNSLNHFG